MNKSNQNSIFTVSKKFYYEDKNLSEELEKLKLEIARNDAILVRIQELEDKIKQNDEIIRELKDRIDFMEKCDFVIINNDKL